MDVLTLENVTLRFQAMHVNSEGRNYFFKENTCDFRINQ